MWHEADATLVATHSKIIPACKIPERQVNGVGEVAAVIVPHRNTFKAKVPEFDLSAARNHI